MTSAHLPPSATDLSGYSLEITWHDDDARTDIRLDEVEVASQVIADDDLWIESFSFGCDGLARMLEALASLANPDFDELGVTGLTVVVTDRAAGGHMFVQYSSADGIDMFDSGSASWLNGGPCVLDQIEKPLRLGDLSRVDTSGDAEQRRGAVGRFADPDEGLATDVDAPILLSLDVDGQLVCEFDKRPQDV
jgi:hypothetical protein